MMKYNLNQDDLDVLFYIHDEKYFSNYQFEKYEKTMPWNVKRLQSLCERGWITRLPSGNKYAKRDVYEVTIKTQRVINNVYSILNGDGFPTITQRMNKRRKRYLETRYKNFMASMVEEIKENKKKEAEFAAAQEAERLRNERIRRSRGQ
jgi:DNA-binding MarR family transcriptional regulator